MGDEAPDVERSGWVTAAFLACDGFLKKGVDRIEG
jgi:hypothetical protein